MWKQKLQELYEQNGKPFYVQKFADFPHPWILYPSEDFDDFIKREKFVSERQVMPWEVWFDLDVDKDIPKPVARAESLEVAEIISERIKIEYGFSHKVYRADGQCGTHILINFPELVNFSERDNRLMKRAILKTIGKGFIKTRKYHVNVQTQHLTMITLEHAQHRKGGNKKLLWSYDGTEGKLTPKLLTAFEEEKALFLKRRVRTTPLSKPDAIRIIEDTSFSKYKDGRDRAAYVMASYYKQFYQGEEVFQILKKWNSEVLNNYFPDRTLKAKVKSAHACFPANYAQDLLEDIGAI